jgi:hypothetical protein
MTGYVLEQACRGLVPFQGKPQSSGLGCACFALSQPLFHRLGGCYKLPQENRVTDLFLGFLP